MPGSSGTSRTEPLDDVGLRLRPDQVGLREVPVVVGLLPYAAAA